MNEMTRFPEDADPRNHSSAEPNNEAGEASHPSGNGGDRRRRPEPIPTEDECLGAMHRIAGLVAMGMLKPAQANAMRASFSEILRHHRQRPGEAAKAIRDEDLRHLAEKDPSVLALFEPLLTADQIASLMRHVDKTP